MILWVNLIYFAYSRVAPGDRSHIPSSAYSIYEILDSDMQRVKSRAPASFKAQVDNTEKKINSLFDHLNNEDLLQPDTVRSMAELAQAMQARDYETAQSIHVDIMTNKNDQCGNWMVSRPNEEPYCSLLDANLLNPRLGSSG